MQSTKKKNLIKLEVQPNVLMEVLDQKEREAFREGLRLYPLKYYVPNGANEEMINESVRCMGESNTPVVMASCANGVGKTTTAVHMMSNVIFGPQNGWFDHPEFTDEYWGKKPKLVWYISTADAISNTIYPMIEELWRKDIVTIEDEYGRTINWKSAKENKSIVSKITLSNGWIVAFKTFDQAVQTYESANVGMIIIDEPAPEEVWRACLGRRRMGCFIFLPMTPLDCPPYIFDDVKAAYDAKRPGYGYVEASVYDACQVRGVRGHLPPDVIDNMVADYDEEERKARAFGQSTYFAGRIYPEYDASIHLQSPEKHPISNMMEFYHVVDPHDGRPCASLWAAVSQKGKVTIFAETPTDSRKAFWNMTNTPSLEQEAQAWLEIERVYGIDHDKVIRIMDKKMGWQTRGRRTFHELFADLDFHFKPSYLSHGGEGEITFGHKKVKEFFISHTEDGPGLIIWDTLRHLPEGIRHYIKRKPKGVVGSAVAKTDGKIVEKYKDFPDALRYLLVDVYIRQAEEENAPRNPVQVIKERLDRRQRNDEEEGGFNTY